MTKKSSKKSFKKLIQSSTILFYTDKRYLFKKKIKNKRFSHITMAQERALKDTNTTNMASPINFY